MTAKNSLSPLFFAGPFSQLDDYWHHFLGSLSCFEKLLPQVAMATLHV